MICENSYLIPANVRKQYDLKDKYLLVVTDLEHTEAVQQDLFRSQIKALKKKLYIKHEIEMESISELRTEVNKINEILAQAFPEFAVKKE